MQLPEPESRTSTWLANVNGTACCKLHGTKSLLEFVSVCVGSRHGADGHTASLNCVHVQTLRSPDSQFECRFTDLLYILLFCERFSKARGQLICISE